MPLSQRLLFGALLAVLVTVLSSVATAQGVVSREAELKGKLVGVLGKLVTWPGAAGPAPGKPLTIGIVGTNPFVDASGVDYLKAKVPTAVILYFKDASEFKSCHILVVAKDANFQAALEKAKGRPVLVVSESPGLAKQGAAMNLVFDEQGNKIRLEINPKTANDAALAINRGLLKSPLVDIVQ